uniref:Pogo transposable element derived with ZNF domain b n=1 Tax=Denticeps clupeoides TaxID=299321 RepID=A0AAY4E2L0_9TELE
MADTDLFMECEEEELEPWQQMNENTEEEDLGFVNSKNTSAVTSQPAVQPVVPSVATPAVSTHIVISSPSLASTPIISPVTSVSVPSSVPNCLPKPAPGQQLILTQGAGGLGTVALSQVLLSAPQPGPSNPSNQPIFITTQGLPVQNLSAAQNPLGIVLNVQQGQTIKPITLVSAPGTQFFKPAVAAPQILNQPTQMRPCAPVTLNRPAMAPNSTFTTVQIPATLTIRNTHPGNPLQPSARVLPSIGTVASPQTLTSIRAPSLQISNAVRFTTVKTSNVVNTLKPGQGSVANAYQTLVANQKTNGLSSSPSSRTIATPTSSSASKLCPRCGAQFKMMEALRSHMCFCCPDLTEAPSTSEMQPSSQPDNTAGMETKSQDKIVMLVDEFYYGTSEIDGEAMDNLKEPIQFKCLTCAKKLRNNIRFMNHMKHHVELEQQNGEVDQHTSCQHCYRQFPTPFKLQCHLESVHSFYESSTKCKICEWAFESEPVFLQHMKNTHKPGEMPYVCQVCQYRSSFYIDVYNHFRTWHEDTRQLLCLYCLKVFKNSNAYQQHYSRHQKTTVYHCNKCRLQFLFTKDKVEHKMSHHKTFRKPKQLEGLTPGTKVTIRAYAQNKSLPVLPGGSASQPNKDTPQSSAAPERKQPINLFPTRPTAPKKQISKMIELLTKFQEQREFLGEQKCIECNYEIPDFTHHYPTYVHCSLCPYSTCCSRAYANHMINSHVPRKNPKFFNRPAVPPPSSLKLTCSACEYNTCNGDLMAKHLVKHPDHCFSICTPKECLESDIEFGKVEEEVEEPQKEGASDVGKEPEWASMDNWREACSILPIPDFKEPCGSRHSLGKSSDALDYFLLLFPNSLLDLITYETNTNARCQLFMDQGNPDWMPTTIDEIKGFIGLSVLMGIQSLPESQLYWSWRHSTNCATFVKTMSYERFRQISSHIRMESLLTEDSSRDKLNLLGRMLDVLENSMWRAYKPNRNLTIDQALLPCLEIESGKEKQNKVQVWLLCDSRSGYCHRLFIRTPTGKDKDLGLTVVPPLLDGLQEKHHHVFLSPSLASIPLMQKLCDQRIYTSASVLPQSPILPEAFWNPSCPVEKSGDFQQHAFGPLLATRWKDTKEMYCISTNAEPGQPDRVWRKSPTLVGELIAIERPLAFKLLQDNMRGVDICNQLLACNPLGRLDLDTNWQCLFYFLVNLSIVNSFIVLRESRKDNPPVWFEGGRFSQAHYRKRLGYQLAKCAERQPQASSRPMSAQDIEEDKETVGDSKGVRHCWAKITRRTRRCKNCSMKNQRHESVFGCSACGVNLCKRPRCFWEYHGLSSHRQGSPRIGFISSCNKLIRSARQLDTNSQQFTSEASMGDSSSLDEDLDQDLAPLEDADSDLEHTEKELQKPEGILDNLKQELLFEKPIVPVDATLNGKEPEESLSVRQLRIVLFALCSGVHRAAEKLATEPKLIRVWLKEKEKKLESEGHGKSSTGEGGPAVGQLVEWVLAQREQQLPVTEENLFQKASEVHCHTSQSIPFRISYEWAVSFMLQHNLGLHTSTTVSLPLPHYMEDKVGFFKEFVQKQINSSNLCHSVIGALVQLSVFVDVDTLANVATLSKDAAFQFVGTGESLVDIHLAVLADGKVLPAVVFFKGQLPGRLHASLPDSVLLEARVEGFTEEEELEFWTNEVWRKYLRGQNASKAMLIMDSHRRHTSESSVGTISATNTLPAIVPVGCTFKLQPLEICVRPALQKFLSARWGQLAAQGGAAGANPKDLVKLVVAWMVEALAILSDRPEALQQSFCLAHVVPEKADDDPAEAQMQLINTLVEAMLGTEQAMAESADQLGVDTGPESKSSEGAESSPHAPGACKEMDSIPATTKLDELDASTEKNAAGLLEDGGAEKSTAILDENTSPRASPSNKPHISLLSSETQ